jgi:hypothetical protein
LRREGCGVFHVVDDALLIAKSAIGQTVFPVSIRPATSVAGVILHEACRGLAFQVIEIVETRQRAEIVVDVVDSGEQRPFFGFNRAKHAVIEAAILATRVHLLPPAAIVEEMRRLQKPVQKTGAAEELQAFELIVDYLVKHCADAFGQSWLEEES